MGVISRNPISSEFASAKRALVTVQFACNATPASITATINTVNKLTPAAECVVGATGTGTLTGASYTATGTVVGIGVLDGQAKEVLWARGITTQSSSASNVLKGAGWLPATAAAMAVTSGHPTVTFTCNDLNSGKALDGAGSATATVDFEIFYR